MFMSTANNGLEHHQEDVFFGDDGQQAVGEYLVVVEEAEHEDNQQYSSIREHWVDEHQYIGESTTEATVDYALTPKNQIDMDFIEKNTTRVLVEHARDEQNNHGLRRKYSMKNRPSASYYKCKLCSVVVKHPSKILEHIRVHTGERPFPCPHCSLTFTQAGALTAHLRIHNGDRPYACVFCAKRFTTSGQRSVHQKNCQMAEGQRRSPKEMIPSRRVTIRRQKKLGEDYKQESQHTLAIHKSTEVQPHNEPEGNLNIERLPEISFENDNFEEPPIIHMETHIQCSENIEASTDSEEISNTHVVAERGETERRRQPPTTRRQTRKRNENSIKSFHCLTSSGNSNRSSLLAIKAKQADLGPLQSNRYIRNASITNTST